MKELDGLRTFAVLAVILYHLNLPFAQNGLLGVEMFFVLSGYLITDILLREWREKGRLELKRFWIRRAKRLLPALFFLLLCTSLWVRFFDPSLFDAFRQNFLAAFFYVSNWWYIFHHISYFQSFAPNPLEHLWSLAVEEQFYLLFPFLLWGSLKLTPNRKSLAATLLILSAISSVLMALLYIPGTDPSRVYYGTDTRAFALLIGATLAVYFPSNDSSRNDSSRSGFSRNGSLRKTSQTVNFIFDAIGFLSLVSIILFVVMTNEYDPFLYRGGMVVFSLLTAILIAVMIRPASWLGKCFRCEPLVWLGKRSYGIYLWHYPVIILTAKMGSNEPGALRMLLQVAATVVIAALSYKFLENPIRYGKSLHFTATGAVSCIAVMGCSLFIPLTASAATQYPATPPTNAVAAVTSVKPQSQSAQTAVDSTKQGPRSVAVKSKTATSVPHPSPTRATATRTQTISAKSSPPSASPIHTAGSSTKTSVTTVGDSIMIDIEPNLQAMIPGVVVDGKVGRQFYQAQSEIQYLASVGKLGNTVVIELGTNGPFTSSQINGLYHAIGPQRHIVFVNTREPRSWQGYVNTSLANFVANHPSNTTLVNWYAASAGHPEYLTPDGVHLTSSGAHVLASLIVAKIG